MPNENELVENVKSERKDVTEHDHEGQALLMHKCQNEDEGIVALCIEGLHGVVVGERVARWKNTVESLYEM